MIEILQLDYPRKSHIISEQKNKSTVITECGLTYEQQGGAIITHKYDPEKSINEQTYKPPGPEARCGNCPWGETLDR